MMSYPRNCCPVCGRPVGSSRYYWRAWLWARWNCRSCGTVLRFDFRRRLLLGLSMIMSQALFFGFEFLWIWFHFPVWAYFIWGIPLLVVAVFFLLRIDRVIVAESRKVQDSLSEVRIKR